MPALKRQELTATLPSLGWLVAFFALPCFLSLTLAFRESDLRGGVGDGWSMETVKSLANPIYLPVLARTAGVSLMTTLVCLLLALPMAWHMARCTPAWRNALLLLVVLPFLTNFIIRIFAWKSLLHPDGPLKHLLMTLHLATEDTMLLNNLGAVLVVMIYTQLPFAILPLYAAAEKFDFQLMDAARDLGATGLRAFLRVFVPGVRQGILSAAVIVFVSTLGQYVVPQFVGGTEDEMIGNKIVQRAFTDRNLPLASAMSGALLITVLLIAGLAHWLTRDRVPAEAKAPSPCQA